MQANSYGPVTGTILMHTTEYHLWLKLERTTIRKNRLPPNMSLSCLAAEPSLVVASTYELPKQRVAWNKVRRYWIDVLKERKKPSCLSIRLA